ncbi:TOBE domain-containing protein [Oceanobacillus arenosus]|uniref:TOBE domain-containing protein n=1 Tax=Oceanobacillus arenosus TaxID=1229153 RepID=UPI001472E07B|nr:TOBE domain-containing protein [Oceanobacillus arenosus]
MAIICQWNSRKIITKQFRGKEYHYTVEVAGKTIVAHMAAHLKFEIGEEVNIGILE